MFNNHRQTTGAQDCAAFAVWSLIDSLAVWPATHLVGYPVSFLQSLGAVMLLNMFFLIVWRFRP